MTKSIKPAAVGTLRAHICKIGNKIASTAGEIFFTQGDLADSLFYVESGRVKLTATSSQGKEAIIAILGPGDFFGEGSLAGQMHRVATAVAMLPSSVFRIEKPAVIRLLHDEPGFSELVLTSLLMRSVRLEGDLIDHLFNSSEKRLARALLLLAHFDDAPQPVAAKFSQHVLAQLIGTTRSRVNVLMNKFRRLGFIDYTDQRNMKVHSSLLRVLLYDDYDRGAIRRAPKCGSLIVLDKRQ
jgi:CRP-like cAMP-binding protein